MRTMSQASPTVLQCLDKDVLGLKSLGLVDDKAGVAEPIIALLNQISDLAPDKVAAIARTLD